MTTTLGPSDNGRTVPVTAGQRIEAVLPQSAGTGYRWLLDPLPDGVELVEERTEPGTPGLVGGTGQRVLTLLVRDPAAGPLRLVARLRRPWEPAEASAQSFTVDLTPADPASP